VAGLFESGLSADRLESLWVGADGKSLSSAGGDSRGQSGQRHAMAADSLYGLVQQAPCSERTSLRRAIQGGTSPKISAKPAANTVSSAYADFFGIGSQAGLLWERTATHFVAILVSDWRRVTHFGGIRT